MPLHLGKFIALMKSYMEDLIDTIIPTSDTFIQFLIENKINDIRLYYI